MKTPRLQAVALGLALAALLPAAAQAQSLAELLEAARGYDAGFLSARAQAEAAGFATEQARALMRTTVGLQASATQNWSKGSVEASSDQPGASFSHIPVDSQASTRTVQVGVSAQRSLFNLASQASISQAEQSQLLAESRLKAAEQDLIVRLSQAYFDVLAAQDSLATVQAGKKAIAEQLAAAKRNFEVGTATITDTREAQARFDLATAQELAADNDLRVKQLALEQLVGRTALSPRPLAQPVALPDLHPPAVGDWISRAEATNVSVQQAQMAHEIARLETEKAKAGRRPTVSLGASLGASRSGGSSETQYPAYTSTQFPGGGYSASVGVTLNMPLFTGGALDNRIKETLLLEDRARNDLEGARRAVAQGTRTAFFGVQSGRAQVKALEAAESSSKLALEAIQLGYKVGVRVNLDVLNAQAQLHQTQRDLARARYEVIVGGLRLRQVSGVLGAEDVTAVNRLLAP
ncbi:TolC family outer membrane protein [Ideonella livida]|uniref:TolC family outer membrane protein n=1 Tax=Ideonella livida TaxID=2707176 RepID=A0A7C9TGT1_9BURK|nr:TolC family outer membrane protein [Ideonella livida]NDY89981.1 TolC family outer membrane protein [Ideonella livida]